MAQERFKNTGTETIFGDADTLTKFSQIQAGYMWYGRTEAENGLLVPALFGVGQPLTAIRLPHSAPLRGLTWRDSTLVDS